jgi:hypothetical protein
MSLHERTGNLSSEAPKQANDMFMDPEKCRP